MTLVDHLERYLGELEVGWSADAGGEKMPFQVARFPRGSGSGTVSFSTLGLSRYPLLTPDDKEIRLELLMIVPDSLRDGPVPGILQQIGMELLSSTRPLLRGEVIGPQGPIVAGSGLEAVYATLPVYFPDEFARYTEPDGTPVAIAWLIPISAAEAQYVADHGWRAFEERLQETDPDLTDVFRASLPIA